MNMWTLAMVEQQWQHAVDPMPQLICVVDGDGRVIRANRTLDRWKLGAVETVRGRRLHDVLHAGCSDPACYLRLIVPRAGEASAKGRRADCNVWDPVLQRRFIVRTTMPVRTPEQEGTADNYFVVTLDDVTELMGNEDAGGQATQIPARRSRRESEKPAIAERVQSRLLAIIDKAPHLVAMADRSGALFYLNPAGRVLLELGSQDEINGITLSGCHAVEMRDRLGNEAIPQSERDGVWSGDSMLLTRDGREVKTCLTLIAHRDRSGELEGSSFLERDVTDWIKAEDAERVVHAKSLQLSARHLTIQETEWQRIGAELHDGIGQSLCLLKLSIEQTARSLSAAVSENTAKSLQQLVPKVKSSLDEMRRISMNLRPSMLDDLGIVPTLAWFFREIEASGVTTKIEREIRVNEADVPPPLRIAIFRIIQEATGNAIKHAEAERINVSLCKSGDVIELSIEDDGKGFDCAAEANPGALEQSLGLQGMRERAELSGGAYELQSDLGKGTRICVRWPLAKA